MVRSGILLDIILLMFVIAGLVALIALIAMADEPPPKSRTKITNIQQVLMKQEYECIILVQDANTTEVKMATIQTGGFGEIKIVADVEPGGTVWLEGIVKGDINYSRSCPVTVEEAVLHVRTPKDISVATGAALQK